MSTQNLEQKENSLPEWFDPYPEPHTLPRGWNLDSIMPNPNPTVLDEAGDPAKDRYH
jgi:hypothetical protein